MIAVKVIEKAETLAYTVASVAHELGWTANRKPTQWKNHFQPEEADFLYLTEILN